MERNTEKAEPKVKQKRKRPSIGLERSTQADRINDRQSWAKLWRMVNCNFSRKKKDWCIVLEFEPGTSWPDAQRKAYAYIRSIRRTRRRELLDELRWLLLRGDCEGKRKAYLFINGGIPWEALKGLWKGGRIKGRLVKDTASRAELERYLDGLSADGKSSGVGWAMEGRKEKGRRWTASRNLKIPWA